MRSDRDVENHFPFGENWQSFLSTISEANIADAERCLALLLPGDELMDRRFLDIGSGSGLAMLAAVGLGAARVDGVDIDENSVAASRSLLSQKLPNGNWSVRCQSVFDLTPSHDGPYDIVYSWGVLHHTGDMWAAIEKAAAMVVPGGRFVLALYRKTPLCGFWTLEKRFYTAASRPVQAFIRGIYKIAYVLGLLATGRNPARFIANYKSARGMDWHHDIHDWLGGYPYQSTDESEIIPFLERLGFKLERQFIQSPNAWGLFGSHCDEYVAVRTRD